MPSSSGVYWFLDSKNNLIYVGKAKNIKARVSSYRQASQKFPKTFKLVNHISKVNFYQTKSELEAILTEAQLINSHQPYFNLLQKDDKSALYIVFTQEAYPRILTARHKQLKTLYSHLPQKNIIGPFSSKSSVKKILRATRIIFKYCQSPNNKNLKPCFYTHLNLCSGACTGKFTVREYQKLISQIKLFLGLKQKKLISKLKKTMIEYSKLQHFEQAALIRDMLYELEKFYSTPNFSLDTQDLPILEVDYLKDTLTKTSAFLHQAGLVPAGYKLHRIEAYDVSNTSGKLSTASMVVFIEGQPQPDAYRRFRIKYTKQGGDPAMLLETLSRRLTHQEWPFPDLIVIDGGITQLKSALTVTQSKIPTISLVKHPDRLLIPHQGKINSHRLVASSPVFLLFQHLRNESHRFAKNYHCLLRRQNLIGSNLL